MAERKIARSSAPARPPAPSAGPVPRRRTTERVAPLAQRSSELPGWIWAGLGCLSVLAAGFAVMFLVVNPPADPLPAASVTAAPATDPTPAATAEATPPSSIQVVPLVPRGAESTPPAPQRPKAARPAPPRALRVARSPSTVPAAEKRAAVDEDTESVEEELLRPAKARTAAKTRAAAAPTDEEDESDNSASD